MALARRIARSRSCTTFTARVASKQGENIEEQTDFKIQSCAGRANSIRMIDQLLCRRGNVS